MNKRRWLGAVVVGVLAALAAACSSEAGSSAPVPSLEMGASQIATDPTQASCYESDVVQGASIPGPDPDSFGVCDLQHPDKTHEEYASPTFVIRLKDCRNGIYCTQSSYGIPCDGYMLPFPTPWIGVKTPGGPTGCIDTTNCTGDTGPYRFERAILNGFSYGGIYYPPVNNLVSHQFMVRHVPSVTRTAVYNGDGRWTYYGSYTVGKARFYNGTGDSTQYDNMSAITSLDNWTTTYTDVNPFPRKCTYVLDYVPGQDGGPGTLVYSGYHSQVGQGHDPIDWPN